MCGDLCRYWERGEFKMSIDERTREMCGDLCRYWESGECKLLTLEPRCQDMRCSQPIIADQYIWSVKMSIDERTREMCGDLCRYWERGECKLLTLEPRCQDMCCSQPIFADQYIWSVKMSIDERTGEMCGDLCRYWERGECKLLTLEPRCQDMCCSQPIFADQYIWSVKMSIDERTGEMCGDLCRYWERGECKLLTLEPRCQDMCCSQPIFADQYIWSVKMSIDERTGEMCGDLCRYWERGECKLLTLEPRCQDMCCSQPIFADQYIWSVKMSIDERTREMCGDLCRYWESGECKLLTLEPRCQDMCCSQPIIADQYIWSVKMSIDERTREMCGDLCRYWESGECKLLTLEPRCQDMCCSQPIIADQYIWSVKMSIDERTREMCGDLCRYWERGECKLLTLEPRCQDMCCSQPIFADQYIWSVKMSIDERTGEMCGDLCRYWERGECKLLTLEPRCQDMCCSQPIIADQYIWLVKMSIPSPPPFAHSTVDFLRYKFAFNRHSARRARFKLISPIP
ncbi:hypothetical protein J6590_027001 [Homalodisca vitripennis]|nr:hypothetical protein J6590_027001 [Homalodisca vitripennis]